MGADETTQTTENFEQQDNEAVADPLRDQLTAAQAQAQTYMEGWQRERAEFANYKRRIERELKEGAQNASINMLLNLLPIIDDFERAMGNVPEDLKDNPWLNGVQLVQRKFQKLLDEHNVTVIDPVGQAFDPSRHEAIATDEDTEVESGHITATLQKGYVTGDRVLRPAMVRVAR